MKFNEILLEYLIEQSKYYILEQPDNEDDPELDPNPHDGEEPDDDKELDPDDPDNILQHDNGESKPPKEKKLSPAQLALLNLKEKWKQEQPDLVDREIDDAIEFFERKKNNLRPINVPGKRNMPEVFSLSERFPDFPADNIQKLRDIHSYTWEQLEFFMERFNEAEARVQFDFTIEGDTPGDRKRSALKKWTSPSRNKIIDNNGLIVHRIEGVDEAMALGVYQHILTGEYGGNFWCVTNTPQDKMGNLYSSYRGRRSFYFVLDTNRPQSDKYHVSALQPIDPTTNAYIYERDYVITPRPNGDEPGKRWSGGSTPSVLSIYPGLDGYQHLFKFFGPTVKERDDRVIDDIVFRHGSPNDFAVQPPELQRMYVRANRNISSPRAFQSMSEALQTEYIRRTTLDNYRLRFKNDEDPTHPFGMIQILSKQDSNTLNFVLKEQCGLPDGINAVKSAIIGVFYNRKFSDSTNRNLTLFATKDGDRYYGIIDLSPESSFNWIKPMEYLKKKEVKTLVSSDRKIFILISFYKPDYSDFFHWLFPRENYLSKNPKFEGHLKGNFISRDQYIRLMEMGHLKQLNENEEN